MTFRLTLATALLVGFGAAIPAADPPAAETATVKSDNLNVRGQAKLTSEIVTRLKKGDAVTVLEVIEAAQAKPGEPARWLKIAMPANTPVWVHKSFVDTANSTVTASRLNIRSGPGENYSILGRLETGVTIKPIRENGDWLEIEAPAGTYAFVAADFVTRGESAVAAAPTTQPTTEPVVTTATPVPPAVATTPPPPVISTTPPPDTTTAPAPAPATLPPAAVAAGSRTEPLTADQEARARVLLSQRYNEMEAEKEKSKTADAVALARPDRRPRSLSEPAAPKRVVTREGIVRPTVSIQAPTQFSLESIETHKLMNFLLSTSTNIQVIKLSGSRVIVTGEEAIDKRWPNIPVLKVESVVVMP